MLPYLFLDVDGVLNALDGLNHGDWDDFQKVQVWAPVHSVWATERRRFNMRFSKKMCAALASLPVEIRWATTWEHLANELLWKATGFNDFPVACSQNDDDDEWKFAGVRRAVEADPRPTVWIDDEAIPPEAEAWFASKGVPVLLVVPSPRAGLTRTNMDDIREFLGLQRKYVDPSAEPEYRS